MHRRAASDHSNQTSLRSHSGQSVVVLVLIVAVFVLLAIGLFSFQINRVEVARSQLRSVTEAAALAGGLSIASHAGEDPAAAQSEAMQVALSMFRKNSVLDVSLSDATLASKPDDSPRPNKASLYMELIDPQTGGKVSLGDPTGKTFNVVGAFCLVPGFQGFLNLPPVVLRIGSASGVPDLDIVICFDTSQSMDDDTPVYVYQRANSGFGSQWGHLILNGGGTLRTNSPFHPPEVGTSTNAVYPQYLDYLTSETGNRYIFDPVKRGNPNSGGVAQSGIPFNHFTDLIADIDAQINGSMLNGTGGVVKNKDSGQSYKFDRFCAVVESYRGNLENQDVWNRSQQTMHDPGYVAPPPQAGYQDEYFLLSRLCMQPMVDVQSAVKQFMDSLKQSAKAHFGFVAYAERAGTTATDTFNAPNVATNYPQGGNGDFPLPGIQLDQNDDKVADIEGAMVNLVPLRGRNIGDAIHQAVLQLKQNARQGSRRVIVVFADGPQALLANGRIDLSPSPIVDAAQEAKSEGIPIFCIGLTEPANMQQVTTDLTDAPGSSGASAVAGNGGTAFIVGDRSQVSNAFSNIARQLVSLVQAGKQ